MGIRANVVDIMVDIVAASTTTTTTDTHTVVKDTTGTSIVVNITSIAVAVAVVVTVVVVEVEDMVDMADIKRNRYGKQLGECQVSILDWKVINIRRLLMHRGIA